MSEIPETFHFELSSYLKSKIVTTSGGCLEWTGAFNKYGYGTASMRIYREYGTQITHRLSYLCAHGVLPARGLVIRHTCGNSKCCNPAHLIEGSWLDVARDRSVNDRTPCGEKHWNTKLTEDDIRSIRVSTESASALARRFGVTRLSIHNIRHRKTWRHVV